MSDFELVYLFKEHVEWLQSSTINFITALSAFLVASYLIADKLKLSMACIILTLFTLYSIELADTAFRIQAEINSLLTEIAVRSNESESSIGWHGARFMDGESPIQQFRQFLNPLLLILGYIGGLIFFFHQRHVGRRA